MKITACCKWLRNLTDSPGEKGFSVIPVRAQGIRYFVLQARAVEPAAIEELKKPPGPDRKPVSIALSMDIMLTYCPGCGNRLEDLITGQEDAFDEDAVRSRKYLSDAT